MARGIYHGFVSPYPDLPGMENAASPSKWNAALVVNEGFDITSGATEPVAPAAGQVALFVQDTGTTPNRRIVVGLKLDTGLVITIMDITI